MKKLSLLLLACTLLVPASLSAANFEGRITTKMTTPDMKPGDQPVIVTYSIKEGFYRMDPQVTTTDKNGASTSSSMGFIMDFKNQQMLMLLPNKMYMSKSLAQPTPPPSASHDVGSKPDNSKQEITGSSDYTVERTGKKEKILGYTAEQYVIKSTKKDKEGSTEIWATDELGTYMAAPGGGNPMAARGRSSSSSPTAQGWENVLNGKGFFPLRIVALDKAGKETMRTETTAIDKKNLTEADFAPPADYQKLDMGGLMKGMMQGFGR